MSPFTLTILLFGSFGAAIYCSKLAADYHYSKLDTEHPLYFYYGYLAVTIYTAALVQILSKL